MSPCPSASTLDRHRQNRARRCGMTVVWVMAVLAVGMALSYAVLRTQSTGMQIAANSRHGDRAKFAAETGVAVALRKMHESSWGGVGTSITGQVNASDRYSVTYQTGDPSLLTTDTNYGDYPFRVTLLASGTSADSDSGTTARHQIRVVARLNPRRLATPPTGWTSAQNYAVFQTLDDDDFATHVPCRIEGPVRVCKDFTMSEDYSWAWTPKRRYHQDLNRKRISQGIDYRPFTGPIHIPFDRLEDSEATLLADMAVPKVNIPENEIADWPVTSTELTYRLYPGGQSYTATSLNASLSNVTLDADVLNNPVGVFKVSGPLNIGNNVTVRGTIVSTGSSGGFSLQGNNVQLGPVNLPALADTTQVVRLPTLRTAGGIEVTSSGRPTIVGLVNCASTFRVRSTTQAASVQLNGRLIAGALRIEGRSEFNAANWGAIWLIFTPLDLVNPTLNFVDWLAALHGLDPTPRVVIRGDSGASAPVYHWSPGNEAIYVPHPSDPGLRWDVIEWTDNPS